MLKDIPALSHFLWRSLPSNVPCWQVGNKSPWPVWILMMWFNTDSHFPMITSLSWFADVAAVQYRWFTRLLIHGFISSQPFSLDKANNFFFRPTKSGITLCTYYWSVLWEWEISEILGLNTDCKLPSITEMTHPKVVMYIIIVLFGGTFLYPSFFFSLFVVILSGIYVDM